MIFKTPENAPGRAFHYSFRISFGPVVKDVQIKTKAANFANQMPELDVSITSSTNEDSVMPVNPEIAEPSASRIKQVEIAASTIAANAWTKDSMSVLSGSNSYDMPAGFGNLELYDDSEELIAKVDGVLDRTNGIMTITELDGNAHHKKGEVLKLPVFSGNFEWGIPGGLGADGRYDNIVDHGPIPKGEYLIGNRYTNSDAEREHPGGDNEWYRLYGSDGKGGYSYDRLANGRGALNLHTGRESNGCVTTKSDAEKDDPEYPHSKIYDRLKEFLDSSSPLEYKNSTFRGKLHVK